MIKNNFLVSLRKAVQESTTPKRTLIFSVFIDLLTLSNVVFNNIMLKIDQDFLLVIFVVLLVFGKVLMLLEAAKKLKVKVKWFCFAIHVVVIIAHQELTTEYICKPHPNAITYFSEFYCGASPLFLGLLYAEFMEVLMHNKFRWAELLIVSYTSFRKRYSADRQINDIVSSILAFMCVVVYRQLFYWQIGEDSEPKRPESKKSVQFAPITKSGAAMHQVSEKSLTKKLFNTFIKAGTSAVRMEKVEKEAMAINNDKDSFDTHSEQLKDDEAHLKNDHPHMIEDDAEGHSTEEDDKFIDIGFDYDVCFVLVNDKRRIHQVVTRTFDKKLLKMYEDLKLLIDDNKKIEIKHDEVATAHHKNIEVITEETGGGNNSHIPLQNDICHWRFDSGSIDFMNKKIRFRAMHYTLQQVIDELNREYGKSDSLAQPFHQLINAATIGIKKSKTDGKISPSQELFDLNVKKGQTIGQPNELNFQDVQTPKIIKRYSNIKDLYSLEFDFEITFKQTNAASSSVVDISRPLSAKAMSADAKEQKEQEITNLLEVRIIPFKRLSLDGSKSRTEFHLFIKKHTSTVTGSKGTEMLNFISHEMRSPLLAVLGFIKLFNKESCSQSFSHDQAFRLLSTKYLSMCELHIVNLLDACLVILDVAKFGATKEIKPIEFDLRKLVLDTMRIFDFEVSKRPGRKLLVSFFGSPARDPADIMEEELSISMEDLSKNNDNSREEEHDITPMGKSMKKVKWDLSPKSAKMQPAVNIEEVNLVQNKFQKPKEIIKSDPIRIKQILVNLISNALKYTQKGNVTVIVEHHEEDNSRSNRKVFKNRQIRISVRDTGIGISEKDISKLFKEFGRVSNELDLTLNSGGIGLGLLLSNNMSKQISVLNKQTGIQVKSAVGVGSTFSFFVENHFLNDIERQIMIMGAHMDLTSTGEILKKINNLGNNQLKQKETLFNMQANRAMISTLCLNNSVCIVDDSEINLEILGLMLEGLNLKVSSFSNPSEAYDRIKAKYHTPCIHCKYFSLIIVDFEMPILNGAELAAKIRALGPEFSKEKLAIICATAQEIDMTDDQNQCFTGQLLKPISMDNVLDLIRENIKPKEPHTCKFQNLKEAITSNKQIYISTSKRNLFSHPTLKSAAILEKISHGVSVAEDSIEERGEVRIEAYQKESYRGGLSIFRPQEGQLTIELNDT